MAHIGRLEFHPPRYRDRATVPRWITAVLVVALDAMTLLAYVVLSHTAWAGGPLHTFGLHSIRNLGLALIASRLVVFFWKCGLAKATVSIFSSLLETEETDPEAADQTSGTSASRSITADSAIDIKEARKRIATDATFAPLVALGIAGLSLVVLVTGGPFASPFSTMLIAQFALGQVRSPSYLGLWYLFGGAIVTVVGLDVSHAQLVQHGLLHDHILAATHGAGHMTVPAQSYVLTLVFISWVTTLVNRSTLFTRPNRLERGVLRLNRRPKTRGSEAPQDPHERGVT